MENVSQAIAEASDKILSGEATDEQTIDAIEWKVEVLNVRAARLEDRSAPAAIEELLSRYMQDSRSKVAAAARRIDLSRQLGKWDRLDVAGRQALVEDLVAHFMVPEVDPSHLPLVMQFGDMLSDTPDSKLAATAFDQIVPSLKALDNPEIQAQLPLLEGIARRLKLPGNKIELEGTFLDGTPLDWQSYRGKVVLVDFWATDCGPCMAEMPNILNNYQAYHEKGFDVLAISLDVDRQQVEEHMQRLPWMTLFSEIQEPAGWDHPMASQYGITAIPRAILVDTEGIVVDMNARGRRLGQALQKLLGDPVPSPTSDAGDNTSGAARTAQNNKP
jgi:thiol-disulfide isomerase/thioredoxin